MMNRNAAHMIALFFGLATVPILFFVFPEAALAPAMFGFLALPLLAVFSGLAAATGRKNRRLVIPFVLAATGVFLASTLLLFFLVVT